MRDLSTKSSGESGYRVDAAGRMERVRTLFASAAALGLGLIALATAAAQPQLPATYYGTVTISGEPAAAGIEIRGFVNGLDCSQSPPGEHVVLGDGSLAVYVLYVVHESQRPGCAKDGSVVTFMVDGKPAVQTAKWKVGPTHLDLSLGAASPIPLPSAAGTIGAVIQTAAAGTPVPGVSSTVLSRPTGTPPTDDVHFDSTLPSGPSSEAESSDGGSSLAVVFVILIGVLVLGAGGAGLFLARRSRNDGSKGST